MRDFPFFSACFSSARIFDMAQSLTSAIEERNEDRTLGKSKKKLNAQAESTVIFINPLSPSIKLHLSFCVSIHFLQK